jgi:hypothetical protein
LSRLQNATAAVLAIFTGLKMGLIQDEKKDYRLAVGNIILVQTLFGLFLSTSIYSLGGDNIDERYI